MASKTWLRRTRSRQGRIRLSASSKIVPGRASTKRAPFDERSSFWTLRRFKSIVTAKPCAIVCQRYSHGPPRQQHAELQAAQKCRHAYLGADNALPARSGHGPGGRRSDRRLSRGGSYCTVSRWCTMQTGMAPGTAQGRSGSRGDQAPRPRALARAGVSRRRPPIRRRSTSGRTRDLHRISVDTS